MNNPEDHNRRVRLVISGRVQGVFFRASTQDEAERLGLVGWVRNLPMGQVEAVVEGDGDKVEQFIAWCRQGPRMARVSGIEITDEKPEGIFTSFSIR